MSPTSAISRLRHYHRQHGLRATLHRLKVALERAASTGQMVLYACELPVTAPPAALGILERIRNYAALNGADRARITTHWNPAAMEKLMDERFAASAELWLLREGQAVAVCGWTLKAKTIEPHFFPIALGDVHLFDFFVFPEFRGRQLNPSLVWQILDQVGREGSQRALIEAGAWNRAQLASLAKTPFKSIGVARKLHLGKSTFIWWSKRPQ